MAEKDSRIKPTAETGGQAEMNNISPQKRQETQKKRARTSFEALQKTSGIKTADVRRQMAEKAMTQADAVGHTGRLPKMPVADTKGRTGTLPKLPRADTKSRTGTLPRIPLADTKGRTGAITLAEIRARVNDSENVDVTKDITALAYKPAKRAKNPVLRGIGNILYSFGYAGEYYILRVWRILRDTSAFIAQIIAWLAVLIAGGIVTVLRSIGSDIAEPFMNFARRRGQLMRLRERERKKTEEQGQKRQRGFLGVRLKNSVQLMLQVIGILMPIAAAITMVVIIQNIAGYKYGLAVEMNGRVIGYVADQTVVESAKVMLRERIRLAEGQQLTDWQFNPTYTIARTNEFTTTQQLTNEILMNATEGGDEPVEATGLYINGELYAVTDQGVKLQKYLDNIVSQYQANLLRGQYGEVPDDFNVSFRREITINPEDEDLFLASSIVPYDELMEDLQRNLTEERIISADGESTISEIAVLNGLTLEAIKTLNPRYAQVEFDYIPDSGEALLVRRAQPFLQVQMSFRRERSEVIPFETITEETDDLATNIKRVTQQGIEGEQRVTEEFYYIDGVQDRVVRIEELTEVVTPPQNEIIQIGTWNPTIDGVPEGYNSAYAWPVPGSTRSSRGVSGYHRGQDINGSADTPIFSSNAGVVISAGFHWSWGWNILIDHGDGYSTRYAHLNSMAVQEGEVVGQLQYIGAMGNTGYSFGNHLHFEILYTDNPYGNTLDPLDFVSPPPGYDLQ